MTLEQKTEKIENFIQDNNLSFKEGERNNNYTILIGYMLYLGITNEDEAFKIVSNIIPEAEEYEDEFLHRIFPYARNNHYENFWEKSSTKDIYTY